MSFLLFILFLFLFLCLFIVLIVALIRYIWKKGNNAKHTT